MRPRSVLVAALFTALIAVTVPGTVNAAARVRHDLTLAATPNPALAGESVLIYGQLNQPDHAGQTINLYHHINGSDHGYTFVGSTSTDSEGFYKFARADGVVMTNRSWYVTGPHGIQSRVVHEGVEALVSLQASASSATTGQPVQFTGTVTPHHAGELVYLQQQIGTGDEWRTLKSGALDGSSDYTIPYRWSRPGAHDVRVLFRGDARNLAGASDPVTVEVQQSQVPDFTIGSSEPIAPAGSTVTISGVLYSPGTTTPEPSTAVQLWGRVAGQSGFGVLANTSTDSQGNYTFTQPDETYNTLYYVATLKVPGSKVRRTANLNQGVQDALTLQASATSVSAGQQVLFTGTVLPDKAGESIDLERLGPDGEWHVVGIQTVRHDSTYQFNRTFSNPGSFTFRVRILSDGLNVGARSVPVTVTVSTPAP